MNPLALITALVFFASLVEGTIEFFVAQFIKGPVLRYISLALGVVVAIVYRLDIVAVLNQVLDLNILAFSPIVNYAVTGIIIGRGANYLNDLVSLMKTKKTK